MTWCARAPGARGDLIEGPPPPAPGCCCAAGSSMTAPGARNPDPTGALGAACPPRPRDRHGAQCAGAPDDARPAGTVVHTTARRDRLDEAIAGLPRRRRAPPPPPGVWPAFALSALTAVSLAVEIGDQGRFKGSTIACLPRPGPLRAPLRGSRPASRGPITKTREHPRPAPADRGRPDATSPPTGPPRPYGRAAALAPAPVAERADAGNRRQTRPLPGPDRPRQEARRGRHRHRPTERRLAVVPGNHGRLGPARPPRPARPARPERLNQVRRNHDLTHQTRSPARRGHTGRSAQGAHAQELWAAPPRGDARLQTSRAPRRRMVMRQPDPRISDPPRVHDTRAPQPGRHRRTTRRAPRSQARNRGPAPPCPLDSKHPHISSAPRSVRFRTEIGSWCRPGTRRTRQAPPRLGR